MAAIHNGNFLWFLSKNYAKSLIWVIHHWKTFLVSTKMSFIKYWHWQKLPLFYLLKIILFWHFYAYTLSAPGCTWNITLSLFVKPILCRNSWVWILIDPPVKFLPRFLTFVIHENLIFHDLTAKGQCLCTSWGSIWNINIMCGTNPESSWYKLFKNGIKVLIFKNYKLTYLDKNS